MYYDRTDSPEGIDMNITNVSKEYAICYYWYFLDEEFKFQPDV